MGRREAIAALMAPIVRPPIVVFQQDAKQIETAIEDLEDKLTITELNDNGSTKPQPDYKQNQFSRIIKLPEIQDFYKKELLQLIPLQAQIAADSMKLLTYDLSGPNYIENHFDLDKPAKIGLEDGVNTWINISNFKTRNEKLTDRLRIDIQIKLRKTKQNTNEAYEGVVGIVEGYEFLTDENKNPKNSVSWNHSSTTWRHIDETDSRVIASNNLFLNSQVAHNAYKNATELASNDSNQRYANVVKYADPTGIMERLSEIFAGRIFKFNEKGEWIKDPR